jgi:hypothetical protein
MDQAQDVAIHEIAMSPGDYFGQTVSVSGMVGTALGSRAFELLDQDLLHDEQILVVAMHPMQNADGQRIEASRLSNSEATVTGTLQRFRIAQLEQQLGMDLQDSQFREWEGQPAIIAESIQLEEPL